MSYQREEINTELEKCKGKEMFTSRVPLRTAGAQSHRESLGDKQDTSKLSHPRKQGSWDVCPSTPICHWLTAVPQELEQDLHCEPLL